MLIAFGGTLEKWALGYDFDLALGRGAGELSIQYLAIINEEAGI